MPSKAARRAREARLIQKYGLTSAQWEKMYQLQEGACPICLKPILKYGNKLGKLAASVDHDHKPPFRVRGLLCWLCNRKRVGNLTKDLARRIAIYLESDFDGRKL
mgnify:CR=1 FL=1